MWIGDTESDSFAYDATLVWMIVFYDIKEKMWNVSFDPSIYEEWDVDSLCQAYFNKPYNLFASHEEMLAAMEMHTTCMHNWFQHDKPMLKRLFPESFKVPRMEHDTFILSQLYNPDRGKHGLAEWGARFGRPKPKYEQWDEFTEEMFERCVEDVKITVNTWYALAKEKQKWEDKGESWDLATNIEYKVADLQGRQEMHGVLFNMEEAEDFAGEVWGELEALDEVLSRDIPLRVIQEGPCDYTREPFTQTGKVKANAVKWFAKDNPHFDEDLLEIWGPFDRVYFEELNLNSYVQIKNYLLTQGWRPTQFTEKGSPQLTEDSYESIKGDLGKLVAKRGVLKHRAQMLWNIDKDGVPKGLINIAREDGRIEAGAYTNGTNTGRMKHRNLVNIPAPEDEGLWPSNRQIRDLFIVPDDRLMMGVDADALEARVEASECYPFPGGPEYAFELTDGDIHAKNAKLFKTDRKGAKAPKYAMTYGCGPGRLVELLECSSAEAEKLFNGFWKNNKALAALKAHLIREWKATGRQYIVGIDGRRITTRSEHSIVNAKFQSTGSILVKVAALILDRKVREAGLDAQQIIIYHDELEYELDPKVREVLGELASEAFEEAGEFFDMNVPITGSPKFGKTWAEVH